MNSGAQVGQQPQNATYEQADAEYVAREVAKWGVTGESLVAVWERVERFSQEAVNARAVTEFPTP